MKKLLFMFAAIVAVSFASCGASVKSEAEVADSTVVETVDTVVVDSVVSDTVVAD